MNRLEKRISLYMSMVIFWIVFASPGFCDQTIMEGVGFGSIHFKESSLKDVREHLGPEDEIEKTKVATSKNYIYRKLGLKFHINKSGKVSTIMTLPNFKGSTIKGINLSSSLKEIEKAYGKNPQVHPKKTKNSAMVWAYPESGIIFWFEKNLFSKRKIKFITITSVFE